MKNILFISHDASRTGAPILLLNFIKWLHGNKKANILTVFRTGGELVDDFRNYSQIFHFREERKSTTLFFKIFHKLRIIRFFDKIAERKLYKTIKKLNIDVIYSNTIVNVDVLKLFEKLNKPVITHVREMESTIQLFGGHEHIEKLDKLTVFFIADSNAVKHNLVSTHIIDPDKIAVIHEYIPIENLTTSEKKQEIKQEINFPEETFIVGASGSGLWRKGFDFFLNLAIYMKYNYLEQNIGFVWVGKFKQKETDEINFDIEKAGLQNTLKFIGQKSNPLDYFSIFDVFFLTSREEPLGIVALEASLFEVPAICFEQSGGLPEYVENDAGFVIPYLDIKTAAEKIIELKNNPELRLKLGKRAKEKTFKNHDIEIVAPKIFDIINNFIK
jgi:glycosyltransferase involved in cell wall biosynthesis